MYHKPGQKPMALEVTGLRGEKKNNLLLFCLLDTYIQTRGLVLLSTVARETFFLQEVVVNVQTYLVKVLLSAQL